MIDFELLSKKISFLNQFVKLIFDDVYNQLNNSFVDFNFTLKFSLDLMELNTMKYENPSMHFH